MNDGYVELDKLFDIFTELEARYVTNNLVIPEFNDLSWVELCDNRFTDDKRRPRKFRLAVVLLHFFHKKWIKRKDTCFSYMSYTSYTPCNAVTL